jgi:transposase-like protein
MDTTLFIKRRKQKCQRGSQTRTKQARNHPGITSDIRIGVKQHAVERMKLGENVSALARELGVDRTLLYLWRARTQRGREPGPEGPIDVRQIRIQELETKIAGLEGALGRKGMELDFFAGALRRIAESRQKSENNGGTASTRKSAGEPQRGKAKKAAKRGN